MKPVGRLFVIVHHSSLHLPVRVVCGLRIVLGRVFGRLETSPATVFLIAFLSDMCALLKGKQTLAHPSY